MSGNSAIEWTDATWNPVTGCTEVSPECDNCYARDLAHNRLAEVYGKRLPVVDTPENRADTFSVRLWPERLDDPKRWRQARMVFVNSMSDLFHVDIPDPFIASVFTVMLDTPRHTYQVLTKRPARAAAFFRRWPALLTDGLLPSHIWIGTSVGMQAGDYRIRHLRDVPAAVHFLSCEPLLEALTLDLTHIEWLIGGGESGRCDNRPRVTCKPEWARSLRDQCVAAGVPFFWKQWGGRTPKAGGRLLDGREWNEYPETTILL